MRMRDYHALGRAEDPRDAVLSASQLVCGFNPHDPSAHPLKTVATITGPPRPDTYYTLAGTFLHKLLLEGKEPEEITVATWTYKTKQGPKRGTMGSMHVLGRYVVPPADIAPANHNLGKAQREVLDEYARARGLAIAAPEKKGKPVLADGWKAFVEARETTAWLSAATSVSATHARGILCQLKGEVEATYEAEHCGLRLRARPDKVLLESGDLVNLKRTTFAHPERFWSAADNFGWWISEAFYELVMGRGRVGWVVVAIAPRDGDSPPMAFVYPCPPQRQERARQDLHEMLGRYLRCLESGRWELFAESLAEQPAPSGLYDYKYDYDTLEFEALTEAPWDEGEDDE